MNLPFCKLAPLWGWLFIFLLSAPSLWGQDLRIPFAPKSDALPEQAWVDSIRILVQNAQAIDSSWIVVERQMNYFEEKQSYYDLVRKRSYLLQQILNRCQWPKDRIRFESKALPQADLPKTAGHIIQLRIASHYQENEQTDTLSLEDGPAPNFYQSRRAILAQWMASIQDQSFLFYPGQAAYFKSPEGALIFIPAQAFGPTGDPIQIKLKVALRKSELLPYWLASQSQDLALGPIVEVQAERAGQALKLAPNQSISFFLPTVQHQENLGLYAARDQEEGLKWGRLELGSWPNSQAICLPLHLAQNDSLFVYRDLALPAKPSPPAFPLAPKKPKYPQLDSQALQPLLKENDFYLGLINDCKARYAAKEKKRWRGKKRKAREQMEFQRELEILHKRLKKNEDQQAAILQSFSDSLAQIKGAYEQQYLAYSEERDSLQQLYLKALRRWQDARDSLPKIKNYEAKRLRKAWQQYAPQEQKQLAKALSALNPQLAARAFMPDLFGQDVHYLWVPSKRLGLLALGQKAAPKTPLTYKAFTFGQELPTYKMQGIAIDRASQYAVRSQTTDIENLNFPKLQAEAPIWLFAFYEEEGKIYLNLSAERANKLPYKLSFKALDNLAELRKAVEKLNEIEAIKEK